MKPRDTSISLEEAVKFHGHLGPYLVLGLRAGTLALQRTGSKKYFGIKVKVQGATHKPKSCLIDGLQLATGATYGKGNIRKSNGPLLSIEIKNRLSQKGILLRLTRSLLSELSSARTHEESELLAKKLFREKASLLFIVTKLH
ncbi:MAG: formylmethanofuran dehydrogenase subunit E family protein [Candidatus Omnitrophica bacterium]|nr:formylmethanofuran dehydrogenase subunit E family protein [Candidatus Omnitrophota bacterium]